MRDLQVFQLLYFLYVFFHLKTQENCFGSNFAICMSLFFFFGHINLGKNLNLLCFLLFFVCSFIIIIISFCLGHGKFWALNRGAVAFVDVGDGNSLRKSRVFGFRVGALALKLCHAFWIKGPAGLVFFLLLFCGRMFA